MPVLSVPVLSLPVPERFGSRFTVRFLSHTEIYIYMYIYTYIYMYMFIEGNLKVKLPTICKDGKAEVGRVREEKSRSEKIRDGESQKREDAGARKGREVAIHCLFPMICGSGGSKSNLAKAAGAEPAGQMS